MTKLSQKDLTRFWSKVEKADGCWLWKGSRCQKGYGIFVIRGKNYQAHRLSYELAYGITLGSVLGCHSCDTPSCVNPQHIWPGTQAENMADRDRKGRTARGTRHGTKTKPNSVARGEQVGNAKLTASQVIEIRQRYANGDHALKKLSKEYGLTPSNIYKIAMHKVWRHI